MFQAVTKDGYRIIATRERWTLSDGGRILNKARRVVDMDGVTEEIRVYRRQ